jgi:Recombinase zinc beta ribbon domain
LSASLIICPDIRGPHLQQRTLATPLIDDGQDPKRAAISQRIVHEVHGPALRGAGPARRRPAVQSHVLTAKHAHADLQAFEPIQPTHPLMIHVPAFPPEQDPEAPIPEAWSGVRRRPPRGRPERSLDSPYLLTGFARCAICGGSLFVRRRTSRGHGRTYYGCMYRHQRVARTRA